MARTDAVWGIDIGQCSLKALRCRPHERPDRVVAEAFDYIEYPKILSQPGADPAELVNDALKQFLSRNSVRGDRVALTVPGQNGLTRFIKLPPVESKKIPDIVRYEARQQIPFDLADVVWDYQRMGGGSEEEGFSLETEIGLFAMKREQVFRALEPLRAVGIEVDFVQLTPLSLYNFLVFDQMPDLPTPDEYDPESPPESLVVLSLGTDATDLIVTNGFRVWQRSVPLGGSHFTKALTKELKLTFAKAEHLKRNATAAPDPKAIFQAMRPVFNDLLTEIQRSLNFFGSLNREAKLGKVIALGNAMKLPGLRKYLSQSLGMEVVRLEEFEKLSGSQVIGAPAFKENHLSFGVCYGLAVQALGRSAVATNLLPNEIVQDRLVREKKPWAVAAAAALMLACTISFASHTRALTTVQNEQWPPSENRAKTVKQRNDSLKQEADTATAEFNTTNEIGVHLMGNVEGRILWLELLKAVNECLPSNPTDERPEKIEDRNEIYIENIDAQKIVSLENWFQIMVQQGWYEPPEAEEAPAAQGAAPDAAPGAVAGAAPGVAPGAAGVPAPAAVPGAGVAPGVPAVPGMPAPGMPTPGMPTAPGAPAAAGMPGAAGDAAAAVAGGPTGPGWVVQISGFHLHNYGRAVGNQGAEYVRNTLIEKLRNHKILLPVPNGGVDPETGEPKLELVSMKELGIQCPTLVAPKAIKMELIPAPIDYEDDAEGAGAAAGGGEGGIGPGEGGGAAAGRTKTVQHPVFRFVVQFAWTPTPPTKRQELKAAAEETDPAAVAP